MWETTFLIAAWLTITPPSGFVSDTTSVMILEFNESMSVVGLFDTNNYSIVDDHGNSIPIYQIGIINTIDGISISDTSLIALQIPKAKYKRAYTTTVNNLVDKNDRALNPAKNIGWYYHGGFAPNLISVPELQIRKE